MGIGRGRIPPGPRNAHRADRDLLDWLGEQFREFGDIYKAVIYGADAYVTRDPDHARHVLVRNPQNYVKGRLIKRVALLLGNGLMTSEGDPWKRQRRMIQPAFRHQAVAALAGPIAAANLALLDRWEAAADRGDTVNLSRDLSRTVLESVLRSIFGGDYGEVAAPFTILSEEAGRSMAFAQTFRGLRKVVQRIVDERRVRRAAESDLLAMLMAAHAPGGGDAMTDRRLLDEVMTLVVAGHETTASTLNWAWYLISRHPEAEARLAAETGRSPAREPPPIEALPRFAYTRQLIDETMRLYPAGWLLTRRALRDDRLGDYAVPAGTEIYIPPYFIQRHPGLWPDPDRFDPDRFAEGRPAWRPPLAMLPFSAGPRNCIGEHFARLQMQIHLVMVAGRLRLRLTPDASVALEAGVNLRSRHDFLAVPERRTPQAIKPRIICSE